MKFFSTKDKSRSWTFRDAVIQGLAPDGGLFMPEHITPFASDYFKNLDARSLADTAFDVARALIGDSVDPSVLEKVVRKTVSFPVPVIEIESGISEIQLYHGPTFAFKDFGARFLAGLMGHFASGLDKEILVVVATSGDTGGAVAHGFHNVKGVRVVILYPSGKVSPSQELQLTTLGGNITAWEVEGTFDDCQRIVKSVFLDEELRQKFLLTSANSINLGRLIPQTFYYFHAVAQHSKGSPIVVSVPSGNFGNLTAGVLARRLGLPIHQFVASTNVNDVVPQYLAGNEYKARPSVQTISNAMDVGDPSNFARLLQLYDNDRSRMKADIVGYSFTDAQTRDAIKSVYNERNKVLDPHGAVGYLGLKKYQRDYNSRHSGVFLGTAHPGKFSEVMEEVLHKKFSLPSSPGSIDQKKSTRVSNRIDEAKERLMSF